jgi:glycosyltransferase involved in cell wall biosynthesis
MKVLHLLASNKFSGAENVVCQIIEMFKNDDIQMVYCSPDGPIKQTLKDKNIDFIPIDNLYKKSISKVVSSYNPDIIHAHDVKASIIASQFAKKVKVISHIHGNDERKMGKLTLKSFLYNWVSKKFSKIFWVSKSCFDKYHFKNKVADKSEILYNIIDIEKLKEKALADPNNYDYDICILGRLVEVKNPTRALNILKDVIERRPETKCAFIGDGELRDACEEFVKSNNLSNNIHFLGFQSNPYKILHDSRLLLMSSINEGTPMAVLEAFALGIPLVSTRVDGAVELITDNRMGYLYDDNRDAVNHILHILNDNADLYKNYLVDFSQKYNNINLYKHKIKQSYNKGTSQNGL